MNGNSVHSDVPLEPDNEMVVGTAFELVTVTLGTPEGGGGDPTGLVARAVAGAASTAVSARAASFTILLKAFLRVVETQAILGHTR